MAQSEFKNVLDLVKNINNLKLNLNNQNLNFKNYTRNNKYITFTNQSGLDVNISVNEIKNQYNKKYLLDNEQDESSIDTSIFNNSAIRNNNFNNFSSTSVLNRNDSETSDMSLKNSKKFTGGSKNNEFSSTSNNFASNLNRDDSETSDMSLRNSKKLIGGNNFELTSSLEISDLNINESDNDSVRYSENRDSSTLNSITELDEFKKNYQIGGSDKFQAEFFKQINNQNGGNQNNSIKNNNKKYEINSSSTSSICE